MNDLVLIETKIHEGDAALDAAEKYTEKAVEMKISAGLLYADAKNMCEQAGLTFKLECKRVTSRSYSQVCKVMQIARSPDPVAEEKRQRERNVEQVSKHRENAVSYVRDQNAVLAGQLEMWEEPPRKADPVEPIFAKVKNEFTTEQLIQLVNKLMEYMRVLGLGGYIQ